VKFSNLFKKEIAGLLTKQAIFSMIIMMALFILLGQVLGGAMDSVAESGSGSVNIANLDSSQFTSDMLARITGAGYADINYKEIPADIKPADYPAELDKLGIKNLIIIPAGYGDSIVNKNENGSVIFVSKMSIGGMFTNLGSMNAADVISSISSASRDIQLLQLYNVPEDAITRLNTGTATVDYTTVDGKVANVSAATLSMVLMLQTMIAPFVVFFLLMMASQMIMTAISTEKIDKTLETLLSTPVSRMSVLMAKMTAAVVAALLNALSLGIGMIFYMGGMLSAVTDDVANVVSNTAVTDQVTGAIASVPQAMITLGLTLSVPQYLLFGLQLILSVAIGLGASLILGAMATDIKSLGTLMMPIMLLTLLPFFITFFTDVNTMPTVFKIIMYLIPFTNAYMAIPNLMTGNTLIFWAGMLYQIVFFAGTMFFAVRMFMSDRLFTSSFVNKSGIVLGRNGGGLGPFMP
jgi:ABC-2 type transport system permease protein